ncbi:MAG TPA: hypothetical protein PKC23_08275 [Candidatus Desulfobacillus sp.]|nr:hypothetical protein [Candidatus Desulfobacillus sp.]
MPAAMTPQPSKPAPRRGVLPLRDSIVISLALAATVGLTEIAYVLTLAGGDFGGRLLAVLPIYFLAAASAALMLFWLLRAVLGRVLLLDMPAHAVLALLTFLAVGLLHLMLSRGMQGVMEEKAQAAAQGGSCPQGLNCLPLRPAQDVRRADAGERRATAERGRLDAEGFALLMRDPDEAVRAALARRADLPQELLQRMAGDPSSLVRVAAAESPRQSDDALSRLAIDRDEGVRLAVAKNRDAPPTALDLLASGLSPRIRLLVAGHPRASEPVLRRLLNGSGDPAEALARQRLASGGT